MDDKYTDATKQRIYGPGDPIPSPHMHAGAGGCAGTLNDACNTAADAPYAAAHETRATDSVSGGQKGRKLARFSLIPFDALTLLAEHFGRGAEKYEDRNWERGYPWTRSYDALLRHLAADMQGEERDAETGSLHIVAVLWHAIALVAFRIRKIGTDDRSGARAQQIETQRAILRDQILREGDAACNQINHNTKQRLAHLDAQVRR